MSAALFIRVDALEKKIDALSTALMREAAERKREDERRVREVVLLSTTDLDSPPINHGQEIRSSVRIPKRPMMLRELGIGKDLEGM